MIAYTRRQLVLLLAVVVAGGGGVAIGEWRRAQPELAAALEAMDRAEDDDRVLVSFRGPGTARPAPSAAARPAVEPVAPAPVDLNRATAEQLTRLPGIGPVLAARIVAARETKGSFESVDDLQRVAGVGAAKLAAFRDRVTVSR